MNNNALDIIKENYTEFSKYTIVHRSYPSVYDGLTEVRRRCLYAAYKDAPVSMSKLSTLSGIVLAYHPHSSEGIADVIINMTSKYLCPFPLFDGKGNFGDQNNPASAPRYLECKLNDIARTLYFQFIDEAPMDNFEVHDEPLYLPTLFPAALLTSQYLIGNGTPNCLIPSLEYEDLKNFIINYIKTGETKVTKQNFVRFTDYDLIESKNRDNNICDLLNTGKGTVTYTPNIEYKDNIITISNLYVLAKFESLYSMLKADITADKLDVRDESGEESVWVIEKVKNKVYDMDALVKKLKSKFTYRENYAMYFNDGVKSVKLYSLGEIISICYEKYKEALISKTNKDINKLVEQKMILECLALMSEHTDIVTNNQISDKTKVKRIKEIINDKYDEYFIEKSLAKPIHMLKNDKKQISKIEQEIADKQKDLYNIDDLIIRDLEKLSC